MGRYKAQIQQHIDIRSAVHIVHRKQNSPLIQSSAVLRIANGNSQSKQNITKDPRPLIHQLISSADNFWKYALTLVSVDGRCRNNESIFLFPDLGKERARTKAHRENPKENNTKS